MKATRLTPTRILRSFTVMCVLLLSACSSKNKVNVQPAIEQQPAENKPIFIEKVDFGAKQWFDLLKDQKTNQAFLATVMPVGRARLNPDNDLEMEANFGRDSLPAFRSAEIVRFFRRNGRDVEITPLGSVALRNPEEGDPSVERYRSSYSVKCVEGVFQIDLTLEQTQTRDFGDAWFGLMIEMPNATFTTKSLTGYGQTVKDLEQEAVWFCQRWIDRIVARETDKSFLETLPVADRGKAKTLDADGMLADLISRSFFVPGSLHFWTEEAKIQLRKAWDFALVLKAGSFGVQSPETSPQIKITPAEIRCIFPVEMAIPKEKGGFSFVAARVVAVSSSSDLLADLGRLRSNAKPDAENEHQGFLFQLPKRHWRILQIEFDAEPLSSSLRPSVLGNENDPWPGPKKDEP